MLEVPTADNKRLNSEYLLVVLRLCKEIEFHAKPNLALLNTVKQRPDKSVNDFLHIIEELLEKHSGLTKPAEICISNWSQTLGNHIIAGLLLELRTEVTEWYVGLDQGIDLSDLCKYSLHAESVVKKEHQLKTKREDELHKAILTIYSAVTSYHRRRGWRQLRGGQRNRPGCHSPSLPRSPDNRDRCFRCRRYVHWKAQCGCTPSASRGGQIQASW